MIAHVIRRYEKQIFFGFILFTLVPVILFEFFPTFDGPAHLYNANLINQLVFGDNSTIQSFFELNGEPVPNWIGHAILVVLGWIMPGMWAEKILIAGYLIGFCYSFRLLVLEINPDNKLYSYLIFPFAYSYLFLLGFYNFSIAIIFLFVGIRYWLKYQDEIGNPKHILVLFILGLLTYFSHIFVFALLLFVIGLHIVIEASNDYFATRNREHLIRAIRKMGFLIFANILPLGLFAYYFVSRSGSGENQYVEYATLLDWLINVRPLIAYNLEIESAYTAKIAYAFFMLLLAVVFIRVRDFFAGNKTLNLNNIAPWFVSLVFVVLFYFTFPDSDGNAGYVSVRLALLIFIFALIWFSSLELPKGLIWIAFGLTIYAHIQLTKYYTSVIKGLNPIALEVAEISNDIPENSIVLPLNYSNNWLTPHISNYLGAQKAMVILENYEATTGYFPVNLKVDGLPKVLLGGKEQKDFSCAYWWTNSKGETRDIGYVFILGNIESVEDSCVENLYNHIKTNFTEVKVVGQSRLYKRKEL